jgi:hypothetical protein
MSTYPFQNLLEINWADFPYHIDEIRLMSIEGKNILIEAVTFSARERYSLSIPELPKGMYLLEIHTSKGRIVKQVVRQ